MTFLTTSYQSISQMSKFLDLSPRSVKRYAEDHRIYEGWQIQKRSAQSIAREWEYRAITMGCYENRVLSVEVPVNLYDAVVKFRTAYQNLQDLNDMETEFSFYREGSPATFLEDRMSILSTLKESYSMLSQEYDLEDLQSLEELYEWFKPGTRLIPLYDDEPVEKTSHESNPFADWNVWMVGGHPRPLSLAKLRKRLPFASLEWEHPKTHNASIQYSPSAHSIRSGSCDLVVLLQRFMRHQMFYSLRDLAKAENVPCIVLVNGYGHTEFKECLKRL